MKHFSRAMRRFFRTSPLGWGIAGVIAIVIAVFFIFNTSLPFTHHYTVKAVFRNAVNIKAASPVRIAGIDVGKVTKIAHRHAGRSPTTVWMQIDDKGRPVHTDATFKIRPRIFLEGNFFVDVQPGSPSAPEAADGHTFPITQTAAPVQLDQVLKALPKDIRHQLQGALGQYSTALAGGGAKAFNASTPYWAPAYRGNAIVNQAALGTQPHDLSGYLKGQATAAGALDANPAALKSLITDFDTTAAAFARQDANLKATIADLPKTLQAAMPALAALNAAFPPVRSLVAKLRPAVETSGPALTAGIPLVEQLRKLVQPGELPALTDDLRPLVPQLVQLNQVTTPLLSQVRFASQCQLNVILPWSRDKIQDPNFPAKVPVYQEATHWLPAISSESRSGDANGQWFRVLASPPNVTYRLAGGVVRGAGTDILGVNPPPNYHRPPLEPKVPCETQQPPDLRTTPGPAPQPSQGTMSPAALAREGVARQIALTWVGNMLGQEGLKGWTVSTKNATTQVVDQVAALAKKVFGK